MNGSWDMRAATFVLSIGIFAPSASTQDEWQEYQDPYGTFAVSCPTGWQVRQTRPGEVEVRESPQCWVRISMLATHRGEGATAWEEFDSFRAALPEDFESKTFLQLSLRPDRVLWGYGIPGTSEGELRGLLAVEVDGILHYGVVYQARRENWGRKTDAFRRIASSLRFGQFKLPEWMHGGKPGPLPDPARPPFAPCWSDDGKQAVFLPVGWSVLPRKPGQEVFRAEARARVAWYVSKLTGEKKSPETLVAEFVGAPSIEATGLQASQTTEARLFPPPIRPPLDPLFLAVGGRIRIPPPNDERYWTCNRMTFTFEGEGGVAKRGFALVALFWSKKKPDPYTAEVFVFWTDRDKFVPEVAVMEQIASWMQSWESWEGSDCRRHLSFLESERGDE